MELEKDNRNTGVRSNQDYDLTGDSIKITNDDQGVAPLDLGSCCMGSYEYAPTHPALAPLVDALDWIARKLDK